MPGDAIAERFRHHRRLEIVRLSVRVLKAAAQVDQLALHPTIEVVRCITDDREHDALAGRLQEGRRVVPLAP
ncbi:hypothetical protein VQ02_11540 [Methylobacterium variabile]|uniref:Uncharacterized protein n=1 Tax=Methylobacterium variabile TaxID=298794 RepID=A0A0J6SYP3_9HYPH|nr:hypothetical protein VQ02_11540 [Methylobacterium variabile]